MSGGTVEHRDVVLAVVGISAGLAGLALVFLGLVVSTYQSFVAPTPDTVLARYRLVVGVVLAAFAVGLACVVVATLWLLSLTDHQALYVATVGLFAAQLVSLLVATVFTVSRLVWDR